MLKNRKHHHINITVPNLTEAKDWYIKVLDFKLIEEFETSTGMRACFITNGEETYELFENTSLQKSIIEHIAYHSDDLQADYDHFKKIGVNFITDGIQYADCMFEKGMDYFLFFSPSNEKIEYCKKRI